MLLALGWIFLSLAIITVFLRLYFRHCHRGGIHLDDWVMLSSLVSQSLPSSFPTVHRKPPTERRRNADVGTLSIKGIWHHRSLIPHGPCQSRPWSTHPLPPTLEHPCGPARIHPRPDLQYPRHWSRQSLGLLNGPPHHQPCVPLLTQALPLDPPYLCLPQPHSPDRPLHRSVSAHACDLAS